MNYAKILKSDALGETVEKANPYHDAAGRFASKDGANFVSIGGVFDRQSPSPRNPSRGVAANASALKPKNVSMESMREKMTRLGVSGDARLVHNASRGKLDPQSLFTALSGSKSQIGITELQLSVSRGRVSALFKGEVHGGFAEGFVKRTIDFDRKDVHHDYLRLKPDDQGAGVVKKMFATAIPEYKAMGMESISLSANLDIGSYAWAKYGFTADTPSKYKKDFELGMENILSRRNESALSDGAKAELKGVRDALNLHKDSKYITHVMSDIKTPNLDRELASDYSSVARSSGGGKNMTFVKTAMFDKWWEGSLNFSDTASMDRMSKYVGTKL